MKKRFTTLLAGVLLAGGVFSSAFAVATPKIYKLGEYVQIKNEAKFLIVEEGKDGANASLALTADVNTSILNLDKSLWKVEAEETRDANGIVEGFKVFLTNKINGEIKLSQAGADVDKTISYAPKAEVATGKTVIAPILSATAKFDPKAGTITTTDAELTINFGSTEISADKKTKYGYKLLLDAGGAIRLLKGSISIVGMTSDQVKEAEPTYKATNTDLDLGFTLNEFTTGLTLTPALVNVLGNDAFKLQFSKDVTGTFTNPFVGKDLVLDTRPVYSAATYDAATYNATLKTAKESYGEGLDGLKDAVKLYADEMLVALNAEGSEAGTLLTKAPNAKVLSAASTALADETIKGTLANVTAGIGLAIHNIKDAADKYAYAQDKTSGKFVVADKAANIKAINDAVTKAGTGIIAQLDALKANTGIAIDKFNADVTTFITAPYRAATTEKPVYSEVTIGGAKLTTAAHIAAFAKLYLAATADKITAITTNLPTITASAVVEGKGAPIAIKGTGKFITIDTTYVAAQEKYLALTTTNKLNELVILKSGGTIVDTSAEEYEFDAESMTKILVPTLGENTRSSLFTMTYYPQNIAGDSIIIKGNALKVPAGGSSYKAFADADASYDLAQEVVIRTLGKDVRALSIRQKNEAEDVINNTRISFLEAPAATLVKDGAIYNIIAMNQANKATYERYFTVNPHSAKFERTVFENVPGTQWTAKKEGEGFTFNNRDFANTATTGGKLFIVGEKEEDMIYTNAAMDTFKLVEVADKKDAHLGYKFIAEEVQRISDYKLSALNYANEEDPYYLAFDGSTTDSLLVSTKDEANAMMLKAVMSESNAQTTKAYKMNDKSLEKQYYSLYGISGKDTLFIGLNDDDQLYASKTKTVQDGKFLLQFRNINNEATEYEVLIGSFADGTYTAEGKLSYAQKGKAVVVALDAPTAFVYDLKDASSDIYKNFDLTSIKNVVISQADDNASKITSVAPFAVIKRTGMDLKAAAIDNDFVLSLDTAYVARPNNIRYAYYITKPVVAEKNASFDVKSYMVSYADSTDTDEVKYSQDGLTRIGFVHANRVEEFNNDSLLINKPKSEKADMINVVGAKGNTTATWAFAIDQNNDNEYRIETKADGKKNKYLSVLNGILVLGNKEQAKLFTIEESDLTPTENEDISADAVKVIAGTGNVTIQNAAGKTVVINNILGRSIAETVLTSDNATIAAPAGIVVVTVDGNSVKAIVK